MRSAITGTTVRHPQRSTRPCHPLTDTRLTAGADVTHGTRFVAGIQQYLIDEAQLKANEKTQEYLTSVVDQADSISDNLAMYQAMLSVQVLNPHHSEMRFSRRSSSPVSSPSGQRARLPTVCNHDAALRILRLSNHVGLHPVQHRESLQPMVGDVWRPHSVPGLHF